MPSRDARKNIANWPLQLLAASVLLSGLLAIAGVLFGQIKQRSGVPVVSADANATLLAGFSLVYLAGLVRRGKRTAWLVVLALFIYLTARNIQHYLYDYSGTDGFLPVILNLLVPGLSIIGLIIFRSRFIVRSETRSIATGLRQAGLIFGVTVIFGVAGFQLMDTADFHREISIPTSLHYTIDQFNLTTTHPLVAQTKRARLFLDSLGASGLIATIYVGLSLFAPIRFRLGGQATERELIRKLLVDYRASSEDFFKLWPPDKAYFIGKSGQAGVAYRVDSGVALVVGDPAGRSPKFGDLINEFEQYCRVNDWQVAFIHTDAGFAKLCESYGYEAQKIGEEAIVNIEKFINDVRPAKYFRQISNRFEKLGYSTEVLKPPHDGALLDRLQEISNDWLKAPGRAERGMMMGYFNRDYLNSCNLLVTTDSTKTIMGFMNQVPSFDGTEANFDLLRSSRKAPGNINDYICMNYIDFARSQGFKTLNMGLAPLAGLEQSKRSAAGSLLKLVYEYGNRFYSFKGLAKFKDKYQPDWQSRYIVYRGGPVDFTRTMNALLRAMRVEKIN